MLPHAAPLHFNGRLSVKQKVYDRLHPSAARCPWL
jgi:hypothetical protein